MMDVANGNTHPWSCLLCGHTVGRVQDAVTGRQLRALWARLDKQFSPAAWGVIHDDFRVELRECGACGFTACRPDLAGNEQFYRELEGTGYFPPDKSEFGLTLELARTAGLRRVLDVGCGDGAFLDKARAAGLDAQGLEFNPAAADKARRRGHPVFTRPLAALDAQDLGGTVDLVTLFQVLEHVSDPVQLMREAAARLRPGGFVAVAVPFAEGIYRWLPYDPHQWPPHHVSRWRWKDFATLAQAAGLKLAACQSDRLLGSAIQHAWDARHRLATARGNPPRLGGMWASALVSFCYRKSGMKFLWPRWGDSLHGHFQKA